MKYQRNVLFMQMQILMLMKSGKQKDFFVKITEYIYRRYFIHWNTQEDVRFLHMDLDRIVTLWFLMRNCFVSWEKEATDVAALVEWVKQRCGQDTKIILLGVSMGAVSVMNALKYTDDVDYVVEDCGFIRVSQGLPFVYRSMVHIPNPFLMPVVKKRAKKYGFDMLDNNPIDVVKNSKVPICVVHGDMDRAVSVECAKELGTVMKNPKSRVEIYEGRDHAYSICDKERYTRMLSDFLDEMFVFPVEQEEEHGK